jgi:tetratricopeptide (TPR) repeat protein
MFTVRLSAGRLALAFSASLAASAMVAAPALAAPPLVLAQFFEHFDDEPEADVSPPEDPALEGPDLPGLDDLAPGANEGAPPESAQGMPDQQLDLGLKEAPFDPAQRPQLLAELYEKLGTAKTAAAAEPIMEAIEDLWAVSGSDTVDLLMDRATQFAKEAEIDLSLSILDAVVDIAPDEAEAWYLRAKVNTLKGKPERALSDLRRALNLDAKHYRAIADLGLLLEQLGAKKEALEAYRRALAVSPFLEDAQLGVEALQREVEGQDI